MTKISVMRDSFEGTDWKRAFAEALMHLVPDMNPDRADELSDGEYPEARKLDPTIAAQNWVELQALSTRDDDGALDRASNGT